MIRNFEIMFIQMILRISKNISKYKFKCINRLLVHPTHVYLRVVLWSHEENVLYNIAKLTSVKWNYKVALWLCVLIFNCKRAATHLLVLPLGFIILSVRCFLQSWLLVRILMKATQICSAHLMVHLVILPLLT
jgi:hypothetical protein